MLSPESIRSLHILLGLKALLEKDLKWKMNLDMKLVVLMCGLRHKKHDGTYLNDDVRNVSEQIMNEMSQNSSLQSQTLSQDDPLGRVLGKGHPGRVHGFDLGPSPSFVFGSTRANLMQQSSNDMKEYVASLEKELAATKSQVQAQNTQLEAQNTQLEAQNVQLEDIKKNFGGALVAVLQNTFGKVPEEFAIRLNQKKAMAQDDQESGRYSSSRS